MASPFDGLDRIPIGEFAPLQTKEGRSWIAGLPEIAAELCTTWGLTISGERALYGYLSVVVPVEREKEQLALKLSWPPDTIGLEETALRAWRGQGAVLLHDSAPDYGALLLERLDARRTLTAVPIERAAEIAGALIRELCIPAPSSIPSPGQNGPDFLQVAQAGKGLLHDIPEDWADLAITLMGELIEGSGSTLVHTDLHYGNVLAGDRQPWVAIDPKPLAGDPERSVPELVWPRVDELARDDDIRDLIRIIATAGSLDLKKAEAWTFVRTVEYWLWAREAGLTVDPERCRRVVEAIVPLICR